MAKKNRGFTWTRADQEEGPRDFAQRRDVHAERAMRQRLKGVAQRLAALPAPARAHLPLDAELLAAVEVLAAQGPKPSRRRQLLRVQTMLRDRDLEAVEAALAGELSESPHSPAALDWQRRLMAEGDQAIQALLEQHPAADRQQLRALCRQARGDKPAARRASERLLTLLDEITAA